MSKLLTEPRLIKGITEKPKKKRYKKTKEGEKPKYSVIYEDKKKNVEDLIRIYKENPLKARVKFYNNGSTHFQFSRTVLFEFENGDFEFCNFITKFGISKNNRIYNSQSKVASISYKKGKFWEKRPNKTIAPMTWASLSNFISSYEKISLYNKKRLEDSKIFQYFQSRFHWVRMLSECSVSWAITFNTVNDKKLYGINDVLRYVMKVPTPIAKIVLASKSLSHLQNINASTRAIHQWKQILDRLTHIEHLTPELVSNHLFMDTCIMARTLDRKINCKWGLKRLKEEHDRWALEITNTVLDCEVEYDLSIRPIFKAFAEYSGYKLLSTNKDMLREGMLQNHCVGTYINRVERGECAIFHVNGYTLQVVVGDLDWDGYDFDKRARLRGEPTLYKEGIVGYNRDNYYEQINREHKQALVNAQFRGKYNESAPDELVAKVEQKMIDFVNDYGFERLKDVNFVPKQVKVFDAALDF